MNVITHKESFYFGGVICVIFDIVILQAKKKLFMAEIDYVSLLFVESEKVYQTLCSLIENVLFDIQYIVQLSPFYVFHFPSVFFIAVEFREVFIEQGHRLSLVFTEMCFAWFYLCSPFLADSAVFLHTLWNSVSNEAKVAIVASALFLVALVFTYRAVVRNKEMLW